MRFPSETIVILRDSGFDWVTVVVAVTAALAGLAGGLGGAWLINRNARDEAWRTRRIDAANALVAVLVAAHVRIERIFLELAADDEVQGTIGGEEGDWLVMPLPLVQMARTQLIEIAEEVETASAQLRLLFEAETATLAAAEAAAEAFRGVGRHAFHSEGFHFREGEEARVGLPAVIDNFLNAARGEVGGPEARDERILRPMKRALLSTFALACAALAGFGIHALAWRGDSLEEESAKARVYADELLAICPSNQTCEMRELTRLAEDLWRFRVNVTQQGETCLVIHVNYFRPTKPEGEKRVASDFTGVAGVDCPAN